MRLHKRIKTAMLCLVMGVSIVTVPFCLSTNTLQKTEAVTTTTLDNMPTEYRESLDWIWQNRILDEKSTERRNLIFDQIVAGNGTLNYVVRWQSYTALSLQQRKDMESMISRQINNWTKYLSGYENWPYDIIDVNVVGWAVLDENLILDRQSDEIVYTDTITDGLHNENASIPELLPCAPSELSRADHFWEASYTYPGGLDKRFDMYLWGTTGFQGGAGGDWGQRISDDYILSMLNSNEAHIIEHEIGHGFGLTDFYGEDERPPSGFPSKTIMWAGDSAVITEYDAWMLRYVWTQIKDETNRFDSMPDVPETTPVETTVTETTPIETTPAETSTTTPQTETIVRLLGDVDGNAKLNISDLMLLKRYLLNQYDFKWEHGIYTADVNKDSVINMVDIITLSKYLTSQISEFPEGSFVEIEV